MIWLVGLLLAGLVAIFFLIDWHLGRISQQIVGIGHLLAALSKRLDEANESLREIERDTDKMPKVEARRADDYY